MTNKQIYIFDNYDRQFEVVASNEDEAFEIAEQMCKEEGWSTEVLEIVDQYDYNFSVEMNL
jgi:hypothetical protein